MFLILAADDVLKKRFRIICIQLPLCDIRHQEVVLVVDVLDSPEWFEEIDEVVHIVEEVSEQSGTSAALTNDDDHLPLVVRWDIVRWDIINMHLAITLALLC